MTLLNEQNNNKNDDDIANGNRICGMQYVNTSSIAGTNNNLQTCSVITGNINGS